MASTACGVLLSTMVVRISLPTINYQHVSVMYGSLQHMKYQSGRKLSKMLELSILTNSRVFDEVCSIQPRLSCPTSETLGILRAIRGQPFQVRGILRSRWKLWVLCYDPTCNIIKGSLVANFRYTNFWAARVRVAVVKAVVVVAVVIVVAIVVVAVVVVAVVVVASS